MIMSIRNSGKLVVIPDELLKYGRKLRRVRGWVNALKGYIGRKGYSIRMITLTYKNDEDWKPRDIQDYLRRAVKEKNGKWKTGHVGYCWVSELTKAGKVHYHILLVSKWGTDINMPDKSREWRKGSSNIQRAKTIWYIVKYVTKTKGKLIFPKGIKTYGMAINKEYDYNEFEYRVSKLKGWMEKVAREEGTIPRYWKIGQYWEVNDKILTSPYEKV